MEYKLEVDRGVRFVVVAALVMLVSYQLFLFVNVLAAGAPRIAVPRTLESRPGVAASPVDLSALAGQHLFGRVEHTEAPVVSPGDAPDTDLALKLTGVLTGAGEAIIAIADDRQESYRVGQIVDAGSGASLHAVYADHVLLDRNGRLERLWFEEWNGAERPVSQPIAMPVSTTELPHSAPAVAGDGVQRLGALLSRVPTVQAGQHTGFRVKPGNGPQALGFQAGDVIIDMEPAVGQSGGAWQPLNAQDSLNVTVVRNGIPYGISIDGTQLAALESMVE